jgi:hypothetical protein
VGNRNIFIRVGMDLGKSRGGKLEKDNSGRNSKKKLKLKSKNI